MNGALAAVAVAVALLLLVGRSRRGGKAGMSVVREKIRSGASIVDVRTPGEFRQGSYPGAVNIPVDTLQSRLAEIPKGRPVVVFCGSGMRSARAAKALREAGYEDVVNAGGLGDMPR